MSIVKISLKFIVIIALFYTSSCKSYNIDKSVLFSTFAKIDSTRLRKTYVQGYYGVNYECLINPIQSIEGNDKNGKVDLLTSPDAELKITRKKGNSKVFYFDSIIIKDSVVYGNQSRLPGRVDTVHISNIKNIKWFTFNHGLDYVNSNKEILSVSE